MSTIPISDVLSFAWTYTTSRVVDYYRYYFSEAITVTTKLGPVKGYKTVSSFDYNYYNFHGIPYAKPPVGELRFKVNIFSLKKNIWSIVSYQINHSSGSATIWSIHRNYKSAISSQRFDCMSSRFIDSTTNWQWKLFTFIGLHAWHKARFIETSHGIEIKYVWYYLKLTKDRIYLQ